MDWLPYTYVLIYLLILLLLSYPLGLYIKKVFCGEKTPFQFLFSPIEKFVYRFAKIEAKHSYNWKAYVVHLVVFSIFIAGATYLILIFQKFLPFNPQKLPSLDSDIAFNTAISFLTNTDWQAYSGEKSLSYFSQMFALVPLSFLSPAIGLCGLMALLRGILASKNENIGNFFVDLTRGVVYILLPLSFILAIFFISQGVVQNFSAYLHANTLDGAVQTIAQGPVASQEAIKILGTNGGGFFNANSAHPFENPTPLSNYVQMLCIFLIPSSLVFTFGKMASNTKHAFSIWFAMALMFVVAMFSFMNFETAGNPRFINEMHLSSATNLEGKELRFGFLNSPLFTTISTASSCGATNTAHSSLLPLSGLVTLVNMMTNEVIFGGVGTGLLGMILAIILAVFIAGLMIGRTPEYLGKKIDPLVVKLTLLPFIVGSVFVLSLLAIACVYPGAASSVGNAGPHGFSEMLYAYTSAVQNNGSAFASLNANTPFWNYTTSLAMLVGRYFTLIPVIFLASVFSRQQLKPTHEDSFPLHGGVFVTLLIGTIILISALTYLPALVLGPIEEHFQLTQNHVQSFFKVGK